MWRRGEKGRWRFSEIFSGHITFWMVDMEKKREKLVAGLTRRHMIRSGSSSSSSPTAAAAAGM